MSYYVTITRRPSPHWRSGKNIDEAEWRSVALAEPGFRIPVPDDDVDDSDIVWTGHPIHRVVPFCWHGGQIDARNPDDHTMLVMARLAARLNSNLLGEAGARFDCEGKSIGVIDFPPDPNEEQPPTLFSKQWFRELVFGSKRPDTRFVSWEQTVEKMKQMKRRES